MIEFWNKTLNDNKTWIGIIVIGILMKLDDMGTITPEQFELWMGFAKLFTGAALVHKTQKEVAKFSAKKGK